MDNDTLYEYCYPRSDPLWRLAVLVGDIPIPGKKYFPLLRTRLAAWLLLFKAEKEEEEELDKIKKMEMPIISQALNAYCTLVVY